MSRATAGEPLAFVHWAFSQETDECIIWPFSKDGDGYGFCADSKSHIMICEREHGPKPSEAHQAAHWCGVSACLNKRHVRWATQSENEADKVGHGRAARGERNGRAKLSAVQVLQVYKAPGLMKDIGAAFGVSESQVSRIKAKKTRETDLEGC